MGKIKEIQGAFKVQHDLNMGSWNSIIASPIGGEMVLLTGKHEDSVEDFIKKKKNRVEFTKMV